MVLDVSSNINVRRGIKFSFILASLFIIKYSLRRKSVAVVGVAADKKRAHARGSVAVARCLKF